MACQCYGRLPCLGGLLERGAGTGRAESWTNQIHCLLASANGLLAQIYQGSETGMSINLIVLLCESVFTCVLLTETCLLPAVADGAVQSQNYGVELAFPHLNQTDPLLLLQLQHRYTAVCLALKHTLRYNTCTHMEKFQGLLLMY